MHPQIIGTGEDATVHFAELSVAEFQFMPAARADGEALNKRPGALYAYGGDAQRLAEWVTDHSRYKPTEPILATRLVSADLRRFGVVVLHAAQGDDVTVTVAGTVGLWNRPTLRHFARLIFNQLGFQRVTLRIRAGDREARDYARRLGFVHEGIQRAAFSDGEDCSLWGMLRDECKFLKGPN